MRIRALTKSLKRLGRKLRSERGFTLVELLVTVTIIGILAAVVTVGVSGVASTSQIKANQALFRGYQSLTDAWLAANSLQDPDKDVPLHASPTTNATTATNTTGFTCTGNLTAGLGCDAAVASAKWYTANGDGTTDRTFSAAVVAAGGTTGTSVHRSINPASTAKDAGSTAKTEFNRFFRLGNAGSNSICVVSTAATNNVLACKN